MWTILKLLRCVLYSSEWRVLFIVVGGRWSAEAAGSKCLFSHPLDQIDITTTYPIHPRCVCGNDGRLDSSRGGVQGRPHLLVWPYQQGRPHLLVRPYQQVRPHVLVRPRLLGVVWWLLFYSKCVLAYKIYNTTRGTLLVLKICMKLIIHPSHFPGLRRSETCSKDRQHSQAATCTCNT
jgi:hypothetical protein